MACTLTTYYFHILESIVLLPTGISTNVVITLITYITLLTGYFFYRNAKPRLLATAAGVILGFMEYIFVFVFGICVSRNKFILNYINQDRNQPSSKSNFIYKQNVHFDYQVAIFSSYIF